MKHPSILIFYKSTFISEFSQSASPAVIISSGTLTEGEDTSLSWSIGESLIESLLRG